MPLEMTHQLLNLEEAVSGVEVMASLDEFGGLNFLGGKDLVNAMDTLARAAVDQEFNAKRLNSRERAKYLKRLDAAKQKQATDAVRH